MSPSLAWASMCVLSQAGGDLRHGASETYPTRTGEACHRRRRREAGARRGRGWPFAKQRHIGPRLRHLLSRPYCGSDGLQSAWPLISLPRPALGRAKGVFGGCVPDGL